MADGLRLLIYDRTCRGRPGLPGLSHAWGTGAWLYRGLRRLDAHQGVSSWEEGLRWAAHHRPGLPIDEIQFWGHGKWGDARVGTEILNVRALRPGHALAPYLAAVRMRLGRDALIWFRTCETLGARPGHELARAFTDYFGCRVAGHTYIIGYWQSGLHSLAPGQEPDWSPSEGLESGTPEAPEQAQWSLPGAPHTIHCFQGTVPEGW